MRQVAEAASTSAEESATKPRLTVIIPSAGRWDEVENVIQTLLGAVHEFGIEIIAVCGGDPPPPPPACPRVRYITVAEPDVFAARAAGVMLATGDVIALLEDHALPDPGWAAAVLAAWEAHPHIDALIHSIAIGPKARAWEVALFTLVFGPFLGATEVPNDRLPVPGIVSFRRSLVPATTPPPGWLEYELFAELVATGRVAMTNSTAPVHVQPVSWRAALLAFHSGRMFAGSHAHDRRVSRAAELRRIRRDTTAVFRQTFASRRRTNSGVLGRAFTACVVTLIGAHVAGQLLGLGSRSVGNSAAALQ